MLEYISVTVFLGAFSLLLSYIYLTRNFNYWKKRGVIGPKPQLLFGNFPSVITGKRNVQYDLDEIYSKYKGKHDFVGVFMTANPQLLILDPKIARSVLVSDFKKFQMNDSENWMNKKQDPIIGHNPFFLNGTEWKEKRSDVTAGLTPARIKAYHPVMLKVSKQMNKYIENNVERSPKKGLNLTDILRKYTIGVVSDCIYGIESGVFDTPECVIFDMSLKVANDLFLAAAKSLYLSTFPIIKLFYTPTILNKEPKLFFTDLLDRAIALRKSAKSSRLDFLNYLIQLEEKKGLSKNEMVAHTLSFLLDGFETARIVMAHCIHMLAKHTGIQERLRKELDDEFGNSDDIEYDKLNELPYLEQCIEESLRLFPPLLFTTKICTEATTLTDSKDKSIQLKPNDIVVIPTFNFQRDEEYYSDPNEYNPDRFSLENGGIKKYSDMGVFLPFGEGPRICLGRKFALAEMKAGIVEIIRNWKITVNERTKNEFILNRNEFLCQWEGGIYVNFEKIH